MANFLMLVSLFAVTGLPSPKITEVQYIGGWEGRKCLYKNRKDFLIFIKAFEIALAKRARLGPEAGKIIAIEQGNVPRAWNDVGEFTDFDTWRLALGHMRSQNEAREFAPCLYAA